MWPILPKRNNVMIVYVDVGAPGGSRSVMAAMTNCRIIFIDDNYSTTTNCYTATNCNDTNGIFSELPKLLPVKSHGFSFASTMPRINRVFGRFLTAAEKAWVRRVNFEPTRTGIRICKLWHACLVETLGFSPGLPVSFDRRIPCWRMGRWKSLT